MYQKNLRSDVGIKVGDNRLGVILGAFALLLLAMVALRPLLPIDETRYLAVAWEMHLSGDPFHLTRNFEAYSHKPPLLFWLINLVWMVTGVSEFAARLVGPACALVAAWATARLARRFWPHDDGLGAKAVLVLAGLPVFAIYVSATMFDAMLSVAVIGGAASLWRIGAGERKGWFGLGVAIGMGTLAKGPVVLLHLLPMLILMRYWAGGPVRGVWRGFGVSLLVGLGIVALWLVPTLITADAAFRNELLWTQSAARLAGGMAHDRPWWFLIVLLPLMVFPFGWRIGLWRALPDAVRADRTLRFLAIWALSGPILFTFVSSKQAHYLVPEYPAFALIVARLAVWQGRSLAAMAMGGAACALALHGYIYLGGLGARYDSHRLAAALAPASALAVIGQPYNAEVNFAARLRAPVQHLTDPVMVVEWASAHPSGMIFGPLKSAGLTAQPFAQIDYNGDLLGIWRAASLTGG